MFDAYVDELKPQAGPYRWFQSIPQDTLYIIGFTGSCANVLAPDQAKG